VELAWMDIIAEKYGYNELYHASGRLTIQKSWQLENLNPPKPPFRAPKSGTEGGSLVPVRPVWARRRSSVRIADETG